MPGGFMKYLNSWILEEERVSYKDDLKQKHFTS